jgi:hypothetical protein
MGLKRLLVGIGAGLLISLSVGTGSASAVMQRPLLYSFGPDGTAATTFPGPQEIAFHQASKRLYVLSGAIHGFDLSAPGVPTPLNAPFPLAGGGASENSGIAIDNSGLPSSGRLYLSSNQSGNIRGWTPAGVELSVPFPLEPHNPKTLRGVAVDPEGRIVVPNTHDSAVAEGRRVMRYSALGVPLTPITVNQLTGPLNVLAFDSQSNLFTIASGSVVWKQTAVSNYAEFTRLAEFEGFSGAAEALTVDRTTDRLFVARLYAKGSSEEGGGVVGEYDQSGSLLREFGNTYGIVGPSMQGVAVNEETNEVFVSTAGQIHVFGQPVPLPTVSTDRPRNVTTSGAELVGHVTPDVQEVTDCFFQYGTDHHYTLGKVPCVPNVSSGEPIDEPTEVSAQVAGLAKETKYYFRLVASSANGTNVGENQNFFSVEPPFVSSSADVLEVTASAARVDSKINPNGIVSAYHYEYGTEDCAISDCNVTREVSLVPPCSLFSPCPPPVPKTFQAAPMELSNLIPGTKYHFRLVGTNNQNGVSYGPDHTFRTFPLDPAGVDPCANAHERKQSGAAKLSRCRAYELVSAADAGGYDVASDLVPGETPLPAYPGADDRFLYTTSSGRLPRVEGNPVNFGTDPYVAIRGADGWETTYAGIPATAPSTNPFASTLSSSDSGLSSFAFGEESICDPCFSDGNSGIPIRLPNGELVQGMDGSIEVSDPEPAGEVKAPFSSDGSHFVFGSQQRFEPEGNEGSVSIYDRDLDTGTTQVASTMPDGSTMSGEVVQLDISEDGRRILIGRLVDTDAKGNHYYDLYMHIGTSPNSVEVADTSNGVLYAGMTDDGTMVYFSTADQIGAETDASADLFRADVGASSAATTRVSTGSEGTGDTDACVPPEDWNQGSADCSVLAFAGRAGVASQTGTVYFVSPEKLDGPDNGFQDQPNLYVAEPGAEPELVALLDNSLVKVAPPSPRPLQTSSFGGSMSTPRALAVDQSSGDLYVLETGSGGRISRFNSSGSPNNFTAGPGAGTHQIAQASPGGSNSEASTIAVDNAPGSPLNGAFYARAGVGAITVYASTGALLGELTGFEEVCGLAVDQSNGALYVSDRKYGGVRRFVPTSGTIPLSKANYTETSIKTPGLVPCQIAVDTIGHVYVAQPTTGPTRRYGASDFAAVPPSPAGKFFAATARAMYVDPATNLVFLNEGTQIGVYTPAGTLFQTFGVGNISNSWGIAVNSSSGHAYATSGNNAVRQFGHEPIPYELIDHPALAHAVEQAEVRSGEDFQVTPDGEHAIFTSKLTLTEVPADGRTQVYHYVDGELSCTSCMPTGAPAKGDTLLAENGTNLSDDGRVFFTSPEQLTLRDTNRKLDAYEWDEGSVNLISTGKANFDSAFASVSSDGKNAFFFTRESIAPQDDNGATMKVYSAREGGGFAFLPAALPCQAADECRGPGTKVASPPGIGSYKGEGGNVTQPAAATPKRCRKAFVKRRGKCVRRAPRGKARAKRRARSARNG